MNNCGTGAEIDCCFVSTRLPRLRLLATAMLAHRTYGLAFFKGVATWMHALRNPCKQVAQLCIDAMTKFFDCARNENLFEAYLYTECSYSKTKHEPQGGEQISAEQDDLYKWASACCSLHLRTSGIMSERHFAMRVPTVFPASDE